MKNWLKQAGFIKSGDLDIPESKREDKGFENTNPQFPKLSVSSTIQSMDISQDQSLKYKGILEEVMEKNNIEGPDFYEFYKSLNGLSGIPIPDHQKYQSAFATLSTLGLTKDKLLQSSDVYISALNTEKGMFEAHLAETNRIKVVDVETEMAKLVEENNALQAKIQENIAKIGELNNSVMTAKSNISSAQSAFEYTYNSFTQNLQNIVNNIKQYIQ